MSYLDYIPGATVAAAEANAESGESDPADDISARWHAARAAFDAMIDQAVPGGMWANPGQLSEIDAARPYIARKDAVLRKWLEAVSQNSDAARLLCCDELEAVTSSGRQYLLTPDGAPRYAHDWSGGTLKENAKSLGVGLGVGVLVLLAVVVLVARGGK